MKYDNQEYLSGIYGRIILKKKPKRPCLNGECNIVEIDTNPCDYFYLVRKQYHQNVNPIIDEQVIEIMQQYNTERYIIKRLFAFYRKFF
jgi:hypothetical protein